MLEYKSNVALRQPLTQAERQYAQELFERHQLSLRRYLTGILRTHEDASDILQETYLRFLWQGSFERLRENARAYLFKIATNLARDLFRKRSARTGMQLQTFMDNAPDASDWGGQPELVSEGEQVCDVIIKVLQELKPEVRDALLLYRFRDLTHVQIAARLGVSERTVERYVKEAFKRIARRLEEMT